MQTSTLKKFFSLTLVTALILLGINSAFAKRPAPPQVEPVTDHGVIYSATFANGGAVNATDIKTNKLLWQVQVYAIHYNPDLETDIQDVFMKAMTLENGKLVITDEQNRHYLLDIHTLAVQKTS